MVLMKAIFEPSGDRITSSSAGRRPYTSEEVRETSAFAREIAAIEPKIHAHALRCGRIPDCVIFKRPSLVAGARTEIKGPPALGRDQQFLDFTQARELL